MIDLRSLREFILGLPSSGVARIALRYPRAWAGGLFSASDFGVISSGGPKVMHILPRSVFQSAVDGVERFSFA
jgi:hypothetical protein